jgi:exodeoxyribonuclease V beta subunit
LADALALEQTGPVLADKIARQFPVAMIDEFQDTDPQQYSIFNTIYARAVEHDHTMIMIGDPKQAIYGFRGADIFTYIQAKTDVADTNHYTLDTNWRSSSALIHGVNGLFGVTDDPFLAKAAIPFYPVNAADKADKTPLNITDDDCPGALTLWQLTNEGDLPISKANGIASLATRTANEIATLLNKAQKDQARIGDESLVAGDICVLVRDRNEADSMRQALNSAGVSSVYLSRQSVFETPLAFEFYLLLLAIYEEKNERAIRAALITPFFNYSVNGLWDLSQKEQDWQLILDQFSRLHKIWLTNGVMAVLQYLLVHNDLAVQWKMHQPNPERLLTDIRHIGELLQQKSMALDGVHRLLGWFHEQLVAAKDEGKVQQLRLEDDSNLVQIVTMHASKGLEYNIVFLPFVCGYRAAKSAIFHADGRLIIDFANEGENLKKADEERLAEDLRLLYVALTRAVYRCYLGVFNLKVGNGKASHLQQTGLGFLLFKEAAGINDESIFLRLSEIKTLLNETGGEANVCYLETLKAPITPIMAQAVENADYQPYFADFKGAIEYDWKVTSYSALSYGVASVHVSPGATDEGEAQDSADKAQDLAGSDEALSCFSFPRGSNPGSCLHDILEKVDFSECVDKPFDEQVIEDSFKHFGIELKWQALTGHWLTSVLNTPLNADGLRLNQIKPSQRLVEMEFYLPMSQIKAFQINRVLSEHLGQTINVFDFMPVQGILKGYIDLIVQWQGKYYVMDYKSNHLGMDHDAYTQKNLAEAMSAHHYHLQYLLYSLALHRYLKQRLPDYDYDYDRYVGGNYYLFLRGMEQGNSHFEGVYFSRPERSLIEKLDNIFAGVESPPTVDTPQQLSIFGDDL